jgi:hypothetical protein
MRTSMPCVVWAVGLQYVEVVLLRIHWLTAVSGERAEGDQA